MRSRWQTLLWAVVGVALVVAFSWAATDREVYETTSPHGLIAHVWLRKAYSIVAFAIVGAIVERWLPRINVVARVLCSAAVVGAYSALIEVAQKLLGSTESWRWNIFDIACGILGGCAGALAAIVYRHYANVIAAARRCNRPIERHQPAGRLQD
ncbi:MAG: hypothetical protein JO193_00345 [Candidatus Eremiobacteraeota bacterium]|nr:hypothetical protein [Candidatus Eremiobacteraeota bacterium]